MQRRIIILVVGASVLWLGCLAGIGAWFLHKVISPPPFITDVSVYPKVLERYRPTGMVDHFPDAIPPEATDVRMAEFAGYLQGPPHLELRMKLPEDELAAIESQAAAAAAHVLPGGTHMETDEGLVSGPWFWTSDDEHKRLPAHYTVYVLHTRYTDSSWFSLSGVAVSTQAGEVIYWYQWYN